MLVDNGVHGDSRVQKAARSAAEAGWDVTLLGRSPNDQPQSWSVGPAEIRLVPTPARLAKRRREYRRVWLRWPLAYPPSGIAVHRTHAVKARQADLRTKAAVFRLGAEAGKPPSLRQRLVLRAQQIAVGVTRRWVSFRSKQLARARAGRPLHDIRDRMHTAFWKAVLGDRAWRRLEPGLWDFEFTFGKVIDELKPDLIHAHDFRMLGVAARATIRARAAGRPVKMVWDAHEFVPGLNPPPHRAGWLPAHTGYEREYAPFADAVVTVSEDLADLLQREHKLTERPAVVLNAPNAVVSAEDLDPTRSDVRTECGLDPGTPLLAYCGNVAPVRGVKVMIEALPQLEGVHVAFVSLPTGRRAPKYMAELQARAVELGVADRLHVMPYVPPAQVSRFLATADAAVSPLHHLPNHEIALSNKFFEFSQARLPVVVSDVRTMANTVRSIGQGEIFPAEDLPGYVRAVRAVLADPERYRAAYDRPGLLESWTWEAQATVLEAVYNRLLPDCAPRQEPVTGPSDVQREPDRDVATV
ncbi:glycosyltransferase family 4 protein [Micromonosporaceae bacterium B7E4]